MSTDVDSDGRALPIESLEDIDIQGLRPSSRDSAERGDRDVRLPAGPVVESSLSGPVISFDESELNAEFPMYLGKEFEEEELRQRKTDRIWRGVYAYLLFGVSVAWVYFVGRVVFLQGMGILGLSDAVLITLLTTTTGNVLASLYVVARYLFPSQRDGSRKSPFRRRR